MISLIIPTLNEEALLGRTLGHLSTLTAFPREVIVSDGGSSDRTVQIAQRWADKVVTYRGEARQTIAAGRNLGAACAVHRYLVFQDADVLIADPNTFFTKAVAVFEGETEVAAITVAIRVSREVETLADRVMSASINSTHLFFNNLLRRGSASGEFQMVRRSSFEKAGGYDEALVVAEDNDLFARLARQERTRMVRSLEVRHPGRRAHAMGWLRLLGCWHVNRLSVAFFGRALSKEWTPIR
jgi:glycosyltransferase involved in cell wall biosynthesis